MMVLLIHNLDAGCLTEGRIIFPTTGIVAPLAVETNV